MNQNERQVKIIKLVFMRNKDDIEKYLESLDKGALLSIIKYGLRGSDAPKGVTVEDIYDCIGCQYISEAM